MLNIYWVTLLMIKDNFCHLSVLNEEFNHKVGAHCIENKSIKGHYSFRLSVFFRSSFGVVLNLSP